MKIIFCDVDGVLNGSVITKEKSPSGFTGVSDGLILNLKKIVDATGAAIVLSSDWRLVRDDREHGKDYRYLVRRLKTVAGLDISGHTDDISWSSRLSIFIADSDIKTPEVLLLTPQAMNSRWS